MTTAARTLDPKRLRRLDIQGYDSVPEDHLAEIVPWNRLAYGVCASLAIAGTALAAVPLLLAAAGLALWAALSPVHPVDHLYNHGIRRLTGTRPLPPRGAPSRAACGLGAAWLLATAAAFALSAPTAGYILGAVPATLATIVATTDLCIPSMIFRRLILGPPKPRTGVAGDERPVVTVRVPAVH